MSVVCSNNIFCELLDNCFFYTHFLCIIKKSLKGGRVQKVKSFKLENIKSFKNSGEIDLKPITIFVGKNSCGKSSLLRFPVLLAQTFKEDVIAPLLLFGNMIDYGNYDDIVNQHKEKPIAFEMEYGVIELNRYIYKSVMGVTRTAIKEVMQNYKKISLRTQIGKSNKRMVVQETELLLDEYSLCHIWELVGR